MIRRTLHGEHGKDGQLNTPWLREIDAEYGARVVVNPDGSRSVVYAEGRTLATYEVNGYDDSDFIAVAVTLDGEVKSVEYASTRYGGGGHAQADATPDLHAHAQDLYRARWLELARRVLGEIAPDMVNLTGAHIEVVRGRKVAKGTKGFVLRTHDGQWGLRLYIETDEGSHLWVSAENCRRIDYRIKDAELVAYAATATFEHRTGPELYRPTAEAHREFVARWTENVRRADAPRPAYATAAVTAAA